MDSKFRDAVAGLACQARNAARLMVRPAATGFVENRVFFQEAYEALQGALDAYEEALEVPAVTEPAPNAKFSGALQAFRCACEAPVRDGLGICRECGGFDDAP